MSYIKLRDIAVITMGQSPESSSYNTEGDGLPFFQGNADFGEIHPTARVWCNAPKKTAQPDDILISVRAPIGSLNYASEECCIGRGLAAITIKDQAKRNYIFHLLKAKNADLNRQGTGSTFKAIGKSVLENIDVPIISPSQQERSMELMDSIESVIRNRRQELEKLDTLIKARFVEMFGDPIENPHQWEVRPLLEVGECKNGMNFSDKDSGVDINCLGVGDFQNLSVISHTETLPKVSLNEMPDDEYLLKDEDIVFVRSNGNRALVGRCVAVYPHGTPTTFSGFCIRFRKKASDLETPYLLQMFKADSVRERMRGRGANIQNLNQKILASLKIPVPPVELQQQYGEFISQIDKSKLAVQKSLDETQTLFDSLMQKYFG